MPEIPGRLITYCTNVHPGDSWFETFAALDRHIPAIKQAVADNERFPIGLRLSERAAREVARSGLPQFTRWLTDNGCFVPTLNGFPYGDFHAQRVKQDVYLPDWRSPLRTAYSTQLADLLAAWLPDGMSGSISTVPVGFKGIVGKNDLPEVKRQLSLTLAHLADIRQRYGKEIVLALEPEPGCLLETTEEVCRFFGGLALPAEQRELLGICYDCCHQAVQFEDPVESLRMLADAGVRIAKVQVSSALRMATPDSAILDRLDEPRYLHQVVVSGPDGRLSRYADLPAARDGHAPAAGEEWRCHFHVPVFLAEADQCATTRFFLEALLPRVDSGILLEVETYTWDVLPAELRLPSLTESIIREIEWVGEQIDASNRRH